MLEGKLYFRYNKDMLDFWYRHNSRFTNIKAKIFLRSDLYNAKALQFVDASKMGAYRLELNWDVRSLYRLLAEKMIGTYMGKNAKKGASYTWIPNHIQDANGQIAPRSFLKCFVFAAEDMLECENDISALEDERILQPARLQGAVARVSADRVQELTQEEYQWLQNLIVRLDKKAMLMEMEEFLDYLHPENWPEAERGKLPGRTEMEILEALLALGIVMKTADNRINVPEIYLHGFGLKRKGGIRRSK